MPLKRFWLLNRTIDRLTAEEDLRQLYIAMAVQSGELFKKQSDALRAQMGVIATFDESFVDQARIDTILNAKPEPGAFDKLRGLANAFGK